MINKKHDDRDFFCLNIPDWHYIGMWKFILSNPEENKIYEYLFLAYEDEYIYLKARGFSPFDGALVLSTSKFSSNISKRLLIEEPVEIVDLVQEQISTVITKTIEEFERQPTGTYTKEYSVSLSQNGSARDLIRWLEGISILHSIESVDGSYCYLYGF